MTDPVITLLIVLGCLVAEAFFSGSEIGVVSADRTGLRHQAANGSRGARLALKMLEKPEWLLSTTLVGTNIAVITNTTVVAAFVIQSFGSQFSWVAVVIAAHAGNRGAADRDRRIAIIHRQRLPALATELRVRPILGFAVPARIGI